MKRFEDVPRVRLMPRTPVIIRVDGKAFHTLARGMDKPFDDRFICCMWSTAQTLCAHVQGCQLAFVQSDEISLLVVDYQTFDTQPWLDQSLQKMVSVSAAIATAAFGAAFRVAFQRENLPLFDSRAFNLPREEVTNYFIWRQQDATRNSIEALGQSKFSHRELHGVDCDQIQEKLFQVHGINWNDCPTHQKRGACVRRETFEPEPGVIRHRWLVDEEIPVFTRARDYVENLVGAP